MSYYELNREAVLARKRAARAVWTPVQKAAKAAYNRRWYEANKEHCRRKKKAHPRFMERLAALNAYNIAHPEVNAARKKAAAQRNGRYIREYKQTHPCVDCGESDFRCLEFDHLNRAAKVAQVSEMRGRSLANLKAEIAKCEVRCANCHHKKTYDENHA